MKITGPSDSNPPKQEWISETNKVADKKAAYTASLNKVSGITTQGAAAAAEKTVVSDVGREIAKIQGQLKKNPDVRADKVESVKFQIDGGSYYVSSDKTASKIVEDIVRNG